MRFESIIIKGYRQYRDFEIDFPKFGDHDLHVIIAENGTGKTNLLNATNWCLYDVEPHLQSDKNSLPRYNLEMFEEARLENKSEVCVEVTIVATDEGKRIQFRRRQYFGVPRGLARGKSEFYVTIFGDREPQVLDGQEATEIVERYVPKRIREYFFFDGERLHTYLANHGDAAQIRDSINVISQVNVLDSAEKHLASVASDYLDSASSTGNWQIRTAQEEVDKQRELLAGIEKTLSEIYDSINDATHQIASATAVINGRDEVVEFEEMRREKERELGELLSSREEKWGELQAFIRQYTLLLSCYEANEKTHRLIEKKDSNGDIPPEIDVALIEKSLHDHACVVCERSITPDLERKMEDLLDQLRHGNAANNVFSFVSSFVSRSLEEAEKYEARRDEIIQELRTLDDKITSCRDKISRYDLKIQTVSNLEEVAAAIERRQRYQRLRDDNLVKRGSYELQRDNTSRALNRANNELDKRLSRVEAGEQSAKFAQFTRTLLAVVQNTKKTITDEVRLQMQEETWQRFSSLSRKRNTYGRVELDEDYQVEIYHQNGQPCLGSCSAGETELLALAFTIALHKVSGNDAVLFIDSPVGRISDEVRRNFADVLLDVSTEKQLILTFTPSEYSAEISTEFDNGGYSTKRHLSLNNEETHVEVNNG